MIRFGGKRVSQQLQALPNIFMGLKEYQAKRNFRRTPEPAGKVRSHGGDAALSFVIQKHAASHLHYDFRLEMEGVLKSWAVPKGLPLRRGERRLAIEVEDHPLDYGGFEGTIAPGNYGAGTVMVWDTGTYQVFGEDPLGALHSGKIHFLLKGKKLKSEWTLVRMRDAQGPKPQWLMLKTGDDLPSLTDRAENRSALTGRSLEEISGAKKRHEWVSNRGSETRANPRSVGNLLAAQARAGTQRWSTPASETAGNSQNARECWRNRGACGIAGLSSSFCGADEGTTGFAVAQRPGVALRS